MVPVSVSVESDPSSITAPTTLVISATVVIVGTSFVPVIVRLRTWVRETTPSLTV